MKIVMAIMRITIRMDVNNVNTHFVHMHFYYFISLHILKWLPAANTTVAWKHYLFIFSVYLDTHEPNIQV